MPPRHFGWLLEDAADKRRPSDLSPDEKATLLHMLREAKNQ